MELVVKLQGEHGDLEVDFHKYLAFYGTKSTMLTVIESALGSEKIRVVEAKSNSKDISGVFMNIKSISDLDNFVYSSMYLFFEDSIPEHLVDVLDHKCNIVFSSGKMSGNDFKFDNNNTFNNAARKFQEAIASIEYLSFNVDHLIRTYITEPVSMAPFSVFFRPLNFISGILNDMNKQNISLSEFLGPDWFPALMRLARKYSTVLGQIAYVVSSSEANFVYNLSKLSDEQLEEKYKDIIMKKAFLNTRVGSVLLLRKLVDEHNMIYRGKLDLEEVPSVLNYERIKEVLVDRLGIIKKSTVYHDIDKTHKSTMYYIYNGYKKNQSI